MSAERRRLSYLGEVLLSFKFADFASGFEFLIAGLEDFGLAAGETIDWGDIAEGAVQTGGIVMVDELCGDAVGVFEGERGFGADGLLLERAVEALELPIALRVMRRAKDVGGLPEADEALEVAGDELGAAVGDDAGPGL